MPASLPPSLPESATVRLEIEQHGTALFQRVYKMDLEGVSGQTRLQPLVTEAERTTWFKVRNPNIHRWKVGKNCLSGTAMLLDGIVATWLARN